MRNPDVIRLTAVTMLTAAVLYPQRLHNQAQDTRATDAKTAATAISTGRAFENGLANLGELLKKRQDDFVRDNRALLDRRLANWSTWQDVLKACDEIEQDLELGESKTPEELKAEAEAEAKKLGERQAELNTQIEALQTRVKAASAAIANVKLAGEWLARIAQIAPAADLILRLQGATPREADVLAARRSQTALTELARIYSALTTSLPERPGALFLEMQLDLLDSQKETLLRQLEIEERRARETQPSKVLIGQIRHALANVSPEDTIVATLDAQAAKVKTNPADPAEATRLQALVDALHRGASLVVRGSLAGDFANTRRSLEERAHSLRESRVVAGVYQSLLLTGANRLSTYYKGGVRPQTIADLVQAAATVGLIPALVTR